MCFPGKFRAAIVDYYLNTWAKSKRKKVAKICKMFVKWVEQAKYVKYVKCRK